jgi:hypothetical protein
MTLYAGVLTGVVASIFSFDLLWNFTRMEIIGAAFVGFLIGGLVACGFVLTACYASIRKAERGKRGVEFVRDQTGLEYLPMVGGRHGN